MNDKNDSTDSAKPDNSSIPQERKAQLQLVPKSSTFGAQINCTIEQSKAFMDADLAKSGLTADDLDAYPIVNAYPAYFMPYREYGGDELDGMWRVRQDFDGKRYNQPGRAEIGDECLHPYFPLGMNVAESVVFHICEGEKKAAALWKHLGIVCGAMGGMGNWRAISGSDDVHPVWLELFARLGVKNVIIIPDGDIHRVDISTEYGKFRAALEKLGFHVDVKELPNSTDKIDELLVEWGDAARENFDQLASVTGVAEPVEHLISTYHLTFKLMGPQDKKYPVLYENQDNTSRLTRGHRAFEGVWYNDDNNQLYSGNHLLREDEHLYDMVLYFQHYLSMPTVTQKIVGGAVLRAALERRVSPLKARIDALEWDGVPRLETMFINYCNVRESDFAREVGRKWLPSMIKRIYEPGCTVDWMLIAVGPQGIGKSSFVRIVINEENVVEYYGDETQAKDNIAKKHMGTIVSLEEFDQMNGKALGGLKYDITAKKDMYRKVFATTTEVHYRSYIYYASTNTHDFLQRDPSGYRRYAPLTFGQVEFAALERDIDQLLAEAKAQVDAGLDVSQVEGANAESQDHVIDDEYLTELSHALEQLESNPAYESEILANNPACMGRHEDEIWVKAVGMRVLSGLPHDDRDRFRARALKAEFHAHDWAFRKGSYKSGVAANVWWKVVGR